LNDLIRGAIIGGLFSLLTVLLPLWLTRGRRQAETQASLSDVIVKSAQALDITSEQLIEAFQDIKNLRVESNALRRELDAEKKLRREETEKFKKEIRRWALYVSQLSKQIIEAGLTPPPFPPDSDPKIKDLPD